MRRGGRRREYRAEARSVEGLGIFEELTVLQPDISMASWRGGGAGDKA